MYWSVPSRRAATCFGLLLVLLTAAAADWPRFRGPDGSGVSPARNLPVHWSDATNVRWKTPLPGRGDSSPVLWGDRIFVTCYSGYGEDEADPGDPSALQRHVVCLDRSTGEILWDVKVAADLPENPYRGFQALHGYATSTPATDSQRVYVFFGRTGVLAFDLQGKQLWQASVGTRTHGWGSATSPVLYDDLVIVNASVESSSLVAVHKETGKEVWRAPGIRQSWNTPVLVSVPDGGTELVLSIQGAILGFDPRTGQQLWRCEGIQDYVCPSVVAADGVVYAIGGRQNRAIAVRAGGRGDVTATHRLWVQQAGSNVASLSVWKDHLYWVSDRGIAYCLDRTTGDIRYQQRLPSGRVYASVLVADGKIYAVSREQGTFVLAASPQFEQLAHNRFETDDSVFNASPVPDDGLLLLRSQRFLYCVGAAGE
jgi:outer membrane protein assembly factor BamB